VIPGVTPVVPVVVHKAALAVQIDHYLREAGFLVSAIRPPTVPANSSRLRITVTAAHTRAQLQNLADVLSKFWQQIPEAEKGKA
jgi:8-amino-7-oxononanoate synthase